MRRHAIWVSVLLGACASSKPPPPKTPATPAPVSDKNAEAKAKIPQRVEAPPVKTPEPPQIKRQPAVAMKLVDEGRAVQRAKGEDGADPAIALYQQALEADPLCTAALWEMGWSFQVKSAWTEAVDAWDRLHKIDPEYPDLKKHHPVARMRRDQAVALKNLPDTGALPPPELKPRDGPTITITAVGDVQFGRAWPPKIASLPPDEAMPLFEHVKSHLSGADITFGNLETVLADEGKSRKCAPNATRCYAFRAPTSFAKTLKAIGFDVMSIANNHTGDFGEEGRAATVAALDAVDLLHSGPVGDLASWETNGVRVGLVAFSTGGGLYRVQDIDTARKVVAALDKDHDIVIVSFHGGAEGSKHAHVPKGTEMFLGENRGDLRNFTEAVIDSGADLVLGHGPHLLRGMRLYRGRLIAFSLGNFASWESMSLRGPLAVSGILTVKLATNGVALEANMAPVIIKQPGIPRIDKKKRAFKIMHDLSEADFEGPVLDRDGAWVRTDK